MIHEDLPTIGLSFLAVAFKSPLIAEKEGYSRVYLFPKPILDKSEVSMKNVNL